MFDLYGCYFKYGAFESDDYNLVFGNIDTSRLTQLSGEKTVNTIYTRSNHRSYITKMSYEDGVIEFPAEIVTGDGSDISDANMSNIINGLFNNNNFAELRYGYYTEVENNTVLSWSNTFLRCVFVNPERIESGSGCIGYKFTIIADSVLTWEDETTVSKAYTGTGLADGTTDTITVNVSSDMLDYIYPTVTIVSGTESGLASRDITIINSSDDSTRETMFVGLPDSQAIIMNGELKHINSTLYTYFSKRNFMRLKNGANTIQVTGNIQSISIKFNNRKYL